MDFNKLEEWFNSEEGKRTIENMVKEQQDEERESKRLEEISNLKYPSGEKVNRGDLFIDLKEKERFDSNPSSYKGYGYYMYVHRINKDDSVDLCINGDVSLKLNDMLFDFNNAELVEREYSLYSPLNNLIQNLEAIN